MFTIIYDPKHRYALPDGLIERRVSRLIKQAEMAAPRPFEVTVSNELMVLAFRLAIKHGRLDHEQVRFRFGNTVIAPDKTGRLPGRPDSLCYHFEKYLLELADWLNCAEEQQV